MGYEKEPDRAVTWRDVIPRVKNVVDAAQRAAVYFGSAACDQRLPDPQRDLMLGHYGQLTQALEGLAPELSGRTVEEQDRSGRSR